MGWFTRVDTPYTSSPQQMGAQAPTAPHATSASVDTLDKPSAREPATTRPPAPGLTPLPTRLGGFTKPCLGRDAAGRKCVVKRNPAGVAGLIENEAVMQKAYAVFGVPVPRGALVDTDDGPALVNPFIAGALLKDLDSAAAARAATALRAHFVVDALLGAWDVLGAWGDNIIVDKAGLPWRIDNGCGLDRRARGGLKTPAQFGGDVTELSTMRVAPVGKTQHSAKVFGGLCDADIAKQIPQVVARRAALLDVLPAEHRKVMGKRLDFLRAWRQQHVEA